MRKKVLLICTLLAALAVAGFLVMHNQNTISQEQLIGVWQEEGFEDGNVSHMLSGWLEVIFTEETARIRFIYLHTGGMGLVETFYRYEIVNNRLDITFVGASIPAHRSNWSETPYVEMQLKGDRLFLNIREWNPLVDGRHFLIRVSD